MSKAQISMWEEKIVDSFAGGGGASTGIELATGRVVDIAINHDPDAILMHKTNHPHTVHYQASVWDVDPLEVTGGSPVGLLWASPDCKHFSKAKGGKPVDKFVVKSANPFLVVVNHAGEFRGQEIGDPLQTITAKHGYGVASPAMVPWTVTNTTNSTGHPVNEPIDTARTGGGGGQMFLGASLIQYHTEQSEHVRGQEITGPIMTIDAANRYGLTAASLVKYYGNDQHGQNIQDPLHTVTAKDREGLTTVHLVKMKGTNLGGPATEPVQTITDGGGHHGVVTTKITRAEPGADLRHWPEIRELLNTYCGYDLGPEDVILFQISGAWYFMADIGLRMLTPRELYRANGFPDDYKIERDYTGQTYGKSKQVARCGNAVPPPFATALVRANLPEWCAGVEINTMEELERAVAV